MRDRLEEFDPELLVHVRLGSDLAMEMYGAVDQAIIGILQATQADRYLGAIGDKSKCFRYQVAKFKPYKGKRGEPMPWLTLWKPVIEHRFRDEWGFISIPELEADDIIGLAHQRLEEIDGVPHLTIVCSPDKDMRQLCGRHFDYKKLDFADVTQADADYNLAFLMIAGDSSDGVAGIPGAGEKKAKEKLKEGLEKGLFPDQVVRSMYYKHFGDYYGDIIYRENDTVLRLVSSNHPYYGREYEDTIYGALRQVPEGIKPEQATLDALKSLGWG